MIRLHPIPDATFACPHGCGPLIVTGWYIPGMRTLAELACPQCGREYYGDLPAGHGLYYPMLLEKSNGAVYAQRDATWWRELLRESYAARTNTSLNLSVEEFRPLRNVVLLNCLDVLYGHCLLKLLNAQVYLDHHRDCDLVVLIPRFLRWLVPDGVAAIWTADLPLRRGGEWNEWLAAELYKRIGVMKQCSLSPAQPHPNPESFQIERFTRVTPFPDERFGASAKVTFIWREDRLWKPATEVSVRERLKKSLSPKLKRQTRRLLRRVKSGRWSVPSRFLEHQTQRVRLLAGALRAEQHAIDFAVVGFGKPGGLPDWIGDFRATQVDEARERAWCERYAQSHLVIGVHGSNMLLPSAHAGAVIDLMPPDRWSNLGQDILLRPQSAIRLLLRYRFLPVSTSPAEVTACSVSILRDLPTLLGRVCN
jgi:hypothetical protein